MLRKRKKEPIRFQLEKDEIVSIVEKNGVNEREAILLAALFIACAAILVYMLQITLIPILTASRIFISFGLIGFLIAFLLRKQLRIDILDGLYYNVFGFAPICMVGFLGINMADTETYTETYKVATHELHGDSYEFELENDAYEDFWRIRTIHIDTRPARSAYIEFTFSDGLLGYKVAKDSRLF